MKILWIDRKEKSAGGLGIGEEDLDCFGDVLAKGRKGQREAQVFTASSGNTSLCDEVEDIGIDGRDGGGIDTRGDLGFTAKVAEVPEESESGDIGARPGQPNGCDGATRGV